MKLTLSSAQWAIFILASIVVAPLSIGAAFGMSQPETAELLQRTFFVMALTSLLQGFFGHKLPILEGPAGLWWGVFLMFAGFVSGSGENANTILRSLELGLFVSGFLFMMLGLFRLMDVIKKLFTPLVTGTYLILLVAQLSGPFVNGVFGVGYLSKGVDPTVAICATITLICTVLLSRNRNRFLSSYSVLISIAFGWLLFAVLGIAKPVNVKIDKWFTVPDVFAWGVPAFDVGVVLTSIFTAFLLMANMVASINVIADVADHKEKVSYDRSGLIMGINQMLTGLFSAVGGVPMSAAAGFIATTKIRERLPFLIGSAVVLMISLFPAVMSFFASIPVPVGYATIFLSIASLAGLALAQFRLVLGDEKSQFIISLSLMAGFGTMFVPEEAWSGLPSAVTSILDNGLVVGVIICIILEQCFKVRVIHRSKKSGTDSQKYISR
jgi:xanthine/uracil permease